jgi:hypothetical protein
MTHSTIAGLGLRTAFFFSFVVPDLQVGYFLFAFLFL